MDWLTIIASAALAALIVCAVLLAIIRDPDPTEPASLESGQPRDAVKAAMDRRD